MRITDHLRIVGTLALLAAGLHVPAQTINAYRYWFDDAAASVVTTTVAGGQQYTLNNVDAAALPAGYHRITFQFKDSNNAWGVPATSLFYRSSGILIAYQYWFDDNVSTLVETTFGATDVIDIATQIDASAFSNGPHTITLRTKDQQNGFSVPITYTFDVAVGIDELAGVDRLLLFPNPAADQITLRIDASIPQDVQLSIMDATGRTVRVAERLAFNVIGTMEFDLSALPSGAYSVLVASGIHQQHIAFIRQ